MLKMMRAPTFLLVALGLNAGLACGVAFGQTATDPLDACAAEKDDAARLACFDRQMALRHGGQHTGAQAAGAAQPDSPPPAVSQSQAQTAAQAAQAPSPQVAQPQATPSQVIQARVTQPQVAQPHGQGAVAPPPTQVTPPAPDANYGLQLKRQTPAAVSATVARLVPVSLTEYAFQLDNGQVWQQTDSRAGLNVRVNDRVTIKPGMFGDFFFTTADRQRIRVKRIR